MKILEVQLVLLNALKVAGENVDTSKSELVCKISDEFLTSCIEAFRPFIPEAKGDAHKNVQVISTLASLPIDSGLLLKIIELYLFLKMLHLKAQKLYI